VVSTNVWLIMPTAYLPRGATFDRGALVGAAVAPTAGARLAPPATRPTATVTAAKRARQDRGVRASTIDPLQVVDR